MASSNNTLDQVEISTLLKQERFYRDSRQWEKFRGCYHPDDSKTRINISWYDGGIDGFVQGSKRLTSDKIIILHDITPIEIHVREDGRALAESTGRIYARFPHDGLDLDLTNWVRFFNRLQKVDDAGHGASGWKLLSLEVVYMFDSITPAIPTSPDVLAKLDFSSMQGTRKSYQCAAWHVGQLGVTIRDDLPGYDRPETVREVEARHKAWIDNEASNL